MQIPQDDAKTVYVTNVSPTATDKTVSDFFSFCGKITQLFLKQEEGRPTKSAIIQFETESAAKTALLLSNALIVDLPIAVVPYSAAAATSSAAAPLASAVPAAPENVTTRQFNVPDEQRSKTSVVISMLAAGYVLGEEAVQNAREFDEKYTITQQANVIVEQVKATAQQLDERLHISEKVAAVVAATESKAKELDEKYHLSDKAQQAASSLKDKANETVAKLKENPDVARGIAKVNEYAESAKVFATAKVAEVQGQVNQAVQERRAERGDAPLGETTPLVSSSSASSSSAAPATVTAVHDGTTAETATAL